MFFQSAKKNAEQWSLGMRLHLTENVESNFYSLCSIIDIHFIYGSRLVWVIGKESTLVI